MLSLKFIPLLFFIALIAFATPAHGGIVAYGICQTTCNVAYVACCTGLGWIAGKRGCYQPPTVIMFVIVADDMYIQVLSPSASVPLLLLRLAQLLKELV
jgi:hypothetical protein